MGWIISLDEVGSNFHYLGYLSLTPHLSRVTFTGQNLCGKRWHLISKENIVIREYGDKKLEFLFKVAPITTC